MTLGWNYNGSSTQQELLLFGITNNWIVSFEIAKNKISKNSVAQYTLIILISSLSTTFCSKWCRWNEWLLYCFYIGLGSLVLVGLSIVQTSAWKIVFEAENCVTGLDECRFELVSISEWKMVSPSNSHTLTVSFILSLSLSLTYLSLSLFVSYSLCFYTHCLFMPLCHSQRFLLLFWSATLNISISHYWTISFYVYFSLVLFICVSYLLSMSLILYLYLLPTLCVFVPVSFTFSPSHSSDVLSSSESCKNLRNVISCHAVAF